MTRLLGTALAAVYLFTRLFNLGALPMVSDEGTYITWGVRALHATGVEDWLASLEDGKQPLLAWLMTPLLAIIDDRLIAGRLTSVVTGLANLLLIVLLTQRLFRRNAAWIAGALYVAAPIALVHDRLALYDSLVTTCALGVLYATLAWSERPGTRTMLLLGLAMGAAVLTKLSALFFVALVPLVALLWRPAALRRWWLLAQAFFLAGATYSVLYLSPIVNNLPEGTFQRYSLTASEVLALPVGLWLSNIAFVGATAQAYLGIPLATASGLGVVWLALRGGRAGWVVAVWVLGPLLAFVLTAKIMYTRYVVFCLVGALPAAAYLLDVAWARLRRGPVVAVAATLLVLAIPARFAAALLLDPARAPWFDDRRWITDRFQYVESNFAGYGLREIAELISGQASHAPVVVLTRTSTGMPRDGVTAYLLSRPNVHLGIIPENEPIRGHLETEPSRAFHAANQGAPVYYVLTDAPSGEQERRFNRLNPAARLELAVPKPGGHSRFLLYRMPWVTAGEDVVLSPSAKFSRGMTLAGFNLESRRVRAGDAVRLTLYWEAAARPGRDYTIFNHVAGAGDTLVGQRDGQPAAGRSPTSSWRPGQFIADSHHVRIRPDAPPGEYELRSGVYELETLKRLEVTRGAAPPAHYVSLGGLTVLSP
ncbi:MAG: ArnT family glycosyltransferase [Chloroflexota bacterium]